MCSKTPLQAEEAARAAFRDWINDPARKSCEQEQARIFAAGYLAALASSHAEVGELAEQIVQEIERLLDGYDDEARWWQPEIAKGVIRKALASQAGLMAERDHLPSEEMIDGHDDLTAAPVPLVALDSKASQNVLAERRRQTAAEGWSPDHDDRHDRGEIALAAAAYAYASSYGDDAEKVGMKPGFWPWHARWWKPSTPRRDLVKAGALILAEIERLDREAAR